MDEAQIRADERAKVIEEIDRSITRKLGVWQATKMWRQPKIDCVTDMITIVGVAIKEARKN